MSDKVNATLKVYYTFNDTKCLARGGIVQATPIAPGADVATVDLRTCALAVCSSSPELIGDQSMDYAIYSLDATEGLEMEVFEGQGLLSWGLSQPARLSKFVSGFVKPSLSGTILEVRIKLSQVTQSSQQDFITSMQNYERISRTLPTTFDYSNWNEYLRQSNAETDPSNVSGPKTMARGKTQRAQVDTLQKVRELAGRNGHQDMIAHFKTTRQQQSSQNKHARMIARQAAATPVGGLSAFDPTKSQPQKKTMLGSGVNTQSIDPASPPLPIPSSPPQMKTFAPPPPTVTRTNSLPSTQNLAEGSNSAPVLTRYTSAPITDAYNESVDRNLKRKASELDSGASAKRTITFSPSKAINAARNSIGAVQQLFKSKSPDTRGSPSMMLTPEDMPLQFPSIAKLEVQKHTSLGIDQPTGPKSQKLEAQVVKAVEDGHPIKFCYNCGNIQTRGNWRQLEVHGVKHNLCNACGVYWKTNSRMRPQHLWNRVKTKEDSSRAEFPSTIPTHSKAVANNRSNLNTPASSDAEQYETTCVAQTSPVKAFDRNAGQKQMRATRSSPVSRHQMLDFASPRRGGSLRQATKRDGRPQTPTRETLHEINPNTPPPASPSPASGNGLEDLVALLATPKRQFSVKLMSSPSPWRSMFEPFDELQKDVVNSPSKQKWDKLMEELNVDSIANFDFDALANLGMSPGQQHNFDSIASFLSSPSGQKIFTSSAGLENDNSTPEDLDAPLSATKMTALTRTPVKSARRLQEHFEEGDSLFTPKRHNTRSQPNSVQRNLRSAGSIFEDDQFGGGLK